MSTYSSLKEKYGSFAVPAYKITCGSAELKRSEFHVSEITVDNCVGETAGAARFSLNQIYERGSRKINAAAIKNLTPGTKVSISLCYGSDMTEVFTGYIDEQKTRFDEDDMSLSAICLDARGLMREGSAYVAVRDKKPQDVATAILDRYGTLVTGKDIKLDAWEQEVNLTQTGSDLQYIADGACFSARIFNTNAREAKARRACDFGRRLFRAGAHKIVG